MTSTPYEKHQRTMHSAFNSTELPDLPALESCRQQDPLTAEHDRNTGRHPRYWRDLDLKAWGDNEGAERAKAQRGFEWNKLKCQLTPQLGRISMEEYRADKANTVACESGHV